MEKMSLRRRIKRLLCTPLQHAKEYTGSDWPLYALLCLIERLIVGREWIGIAKIIHRDRAGNVIDVAYAYNAAGMVNGGENAMLDSFFRNQNHPAGFKLRFYNDTVAETDTPTDLLGEPSGNGYAPLTIARNTTDWPTLALDSGDWKVTSKVGTMQATGGSWGPVNTMCLVTSDATERLLAFYDLPIPKTLLSGETFDCSFSVKLG